MIDGIFIPRETRAWSLPNLAIIAGRNGAPVHIEFLHNNADGTITFRNLSNGCTTFRMWANQDVIELIPENENDPIVQAELACALAEKGVEF